MNPPNTGSRAPFFIVLILLLVITGVQFFFNFRGLSSDAAMDQAQIASFPTPSSGNRRPFWQVRGKVW